jgi:predicted ATPase/class 3 adenylate cyclase/Tfp pilus assembly protein PilF
MPELPRGTVTFLFTDIEGSTRRWEQDRPAMAAAVSRHLVLLRRAIEAHGGILYKVVGDAVQAAFPTAPAAVAAAVAAQRALLTEAWPESVGPLRVRMALHAGEAHPDQGDYLAPALNRLSRVLAVGHGGQILLTQVVHGLLAEGSAPASVTLHELGEYRLRDLVEPERIWQAAAPGLPAAFPPLVTRSAPPTNLPLQPTPLIGREADVAVIADLLRTGQTRLVTLTGPGGTGKTRLALEIAAQLTDLAPDGVSFVDLAPIDDAALAPSVIAGILGLREEGGRDLRATLIDFVRPRKMLLVLDNLEQIRPAADFARLAAEALTVCPELRLLATSRAPLKLRAEREYPVPPLPIPDARHLPPLAHLAQNAAVQLFVARAQAANPAFALTSDNAAAVAEICARLDGLPLAIELAAARIRGLTARDLARRLGAHLDLLASRAADRPDRQQTLRTAIAWSYDLLPPAEQALYRRVAVFAGGLTLESAEAIAAAGSPLALDPLDGLTALIEQSLLRLDEEPDPPRYRMLETLRAYGQERLATAGEEEAIRAVHASIVLAATRSTADGLRGPDAARWSEILEAEHDNLRAALRWATDAGQAELALALAGAAWTFWETRGYLTEGRMWLDAVLAASPTDASTERAEALLGAGGLARLQGDLMSAAALAEESLGVWRQRGDRTGEARALRALAVVADRQGDEARALALCGQSLELSRQVGDTFGIAVALNSLGVILWNTGQSAAARAMLEESLALERRAGHRARLPMPLNNLALLAIETGELAQARAYLEESLVIDRELGRQSGVADTLENLGMVALADGDLSQAARLFAESLQFHRELGDRYSVANALESIASVATETGDAAAAARLYAAAAALREAIGAPLPQSETSRHEQGVAATRAHLDPDAFTASWEAGARLAWTEAAAEALATAQRIVDQAAVAEAVGSI